MVPLRANRTTCADHTYSLLIISTRTPSTGSPRPFANCAKLTLTQASRSGGSELLDLSEARNVKALVNHAYGYRLRVDSYRVFSTLMVLYA